MDPMPLMAPIPARSWWGRNWKWFVPVLGVGGLLLFAGLAFSLASAVFGIMRCSDAYKVAVEKAKASPAVIQELGSPIREGFFVTGRINVSGPSGKADLSIPISGPNGKATVYVDAVKSMGRWNFRQLEVEIEKTGRRIDISNLLGQTSGPVASRPAHTQPA